METFNTAIVVLCDKCIYKLSKISGNFDRDTTDQEYENCKKDCIVFKGTHSINEKIDHVLQFKGEFKRVDNKLFNYYMYLFAHNGLSCDLYLALNDLPLWKTVVSLIKNGSEIVSINIFYIHVNQNKKVFNTFILGVEEVILILR